MAINFHLPRSIPWITQQVEPGTQARTLVDERFDSIAALVEDSRLDFASAIAAMNASLSPIIVGELAGIMSQYIDLGLQANCFCSIAG